MHVDMSEVHNSTFARPLQDAGYTTGLFGKYMNAMPEYKPLGWDTWFANDGGDYMSPKFRTGLWDSVYFPGGYTTAVVGNESVKWIRTAQEPYFAYIAPKAAHEPFNPAPWYIDYWDPAWPSHEVRPDHCWNASFADRADHASNIPSQKLMTDQAATIVTGVFQNRWRTLLSVDDLIAAVVKEIDFSNTYVIFTSDHGFQLGELNILMDKRHAYDWDTRIHLVVKGPGISSKKEIASLGTNVDLGPTILDLAGLPPLDQFDGTSLKPLLLDDDDLLLGRFDDDDDELIRSRREVLQRSATRSTIFLEYYFVDSNTKCVGDCVSPRNDYPNEDANCINLSVVPNVDCWAQGCTTDCYPTEDDGNNFIGLRILNATSNLLYIKYQEGNQNLGNIDFSNPDFIEIFDLTTDPWMTTNLYSTSSSTKTFSFEDSALMAYYKCAQEGCRSLVV